MTATTAQWLTEKNGNKKVIQNWLFAFWRTSLCLWHNSIVLIVWLGSECWSQNIQPVSSLNKNPLHSWCAQYVMLRQVNPITGFSPPFSLQRRHLGGVLRKQHRLVVCPSRNVQRHIGHRQEGSFWVQLLHQLAPQNSSITEKRQYSS